MASKRYVGAERSFVELSNELAKKHQVRAIVPKGCQFKQKFSSEVEVVELPGSSRYNPFVYAALLQALKGMDIVHTHSAKATEMVARIKPLLNIPFIATKRNSEKASRKVRYFDIADMAVGVSEEVTDSIQNPNKTTIYNGIEVKEVQVQKEPIFTMIAIGILQPRKGFKELIEIAKELAFDFRLWIVGEGEQREELEALIESLGLEEKVKLLGQREDIPELLSRAHLQIINSYREGLSRVLIEGLFYSDLIISTKVAGSVEILSEEFLFDRSELKVKIEDIYQNYECYKEAFLPIKQKRHFFMLSRVANEYERLYKELLGV